MRAVKLECTFPKSLRQNKTIFTQIRSEVWIEDFLGLINKPMLNHTWQKWFCLCDPFFFPTKRSMLHFSFYLSQAALNRPHCPFDLEHELTQSSMTNLNWTLSFGSVFPLSQLLAPALLEEVLLSTSSKTEISTPIHTRHPTPPTYSFWAFKPVYTKTFRHCDCIFKIGAIRILLAENTQDIGKLL